MFSLLRQVTRASAPTSALKASFSVSAQAQAKNLYLGNLSWSLTADSLRSAIAQQVAAQQAELTDSSAESAETTEGASAETSNEPLTAEEIEQQCSDLVIITDRLSGRSRGYGFLKVETDSLGDKILQAMAEVEIEGRVLSVREAEQRPAYDGATRQPRRSYDGGERRGGGGGGYGGDRRQTGGYGGGGDRRGGGGGGGYGGERRGGERRFGGDRDGGRGRGRHEDGEY